MISWHQHLIVLIRLGCAKMTEQAAGSHSMVAACRGGARTQRRKFWTCETIKSLEYQCATCRVGIALVANTSMSAAPLWEEPSWKALRDDTRKATMAMIVVLLWITSQTSDHRRGRGHHDAKGSIWSLGLEQSHMLRAPRESCKPRVTSYTTRRDPVAEVPSRTQQLWRSQVGCPVLMLSFPPPPPAEVAEVPTLAGLRVQGCGIPPLRV